MSLIQTCNSVDGGVTVFCDSCHRSVGDFTLEEAGMLAVANVQPLCFECDSLVAGSVPGVLAFPSDGQYVLAIDDVHFFVEWGGPGGCLCREITGGVFVALADSLNGGVRPSSLSSSTYLHRNNSKRGGVR